MRAELVDKLKSAGVLTDAALSGWRDAGPLLAALDAICEDGATAVIKVDGGRDQDVYTVIVSGGKLADEFFRRDGSDMQMLLESAVHFYNDKVWKL